LSSFLRVKVVSAVNHVFHSVNQLLTAVNLFLNCLNILLINNYILLSHNENDILSKYCLYKENSQINIDYEAINIEKYELNDFNYFNLANLNLVLNYKTKYQSVVIIIKNKDKKLKNYYCVNHKQRNWEIIGEKINKNDNNLLNLINRSLKEEINENFINFNYLNGYLIQNKNSNIFIIILENKNELLNQKITDKSIIYSDWCDYNNLNNWSKKYFEFISIINNEQYL